MDAWVVAGAGGDTAMLPAELMFDPAGGGGAAGGTATAAVVSANI